MYPYLAGPVKGLLPLRVQRLQLRGGLAFVFLDFAISKVHVHIRVGLAVTVSGDEVTSVMHRHLDRYIHI